uniref:Uncharacterized protein n=1 Tax=Rhizophagus irregularis (strain DAOM 181602 / DAOM 197198 / MUCL 43194) TaxID=747089 RepID=U9U7V1_RHIID
MPINSSESRFSPPPLPPSPPLFRFFANDIPQLIQYHIQRLEYESSEPTLRINEQKGDKKKHYDSRFKVNIVLIKLEESSGFMKSSDVFRCSSNQSMKFDIASVVV